jgi:molecular chaperone Hsp33
MLGRKEVESIVAERGEVEVNCEFCNQRYTFDAGESAAIFANHAASAARATRH